MEIRQRRIQFENGFTPIDSLPGVVNQRALGLTGFALLCNPAIIKARLPKRDRETFDHLVNESNESDEVAMILASIPDGLGLENGVADLISGALKIYSHKISSHQMKPHHAMLAGLKAAKLLNDRAEI